MQWQCRHSQNDTLWRYRQLPLWKWWSRTLQACCLLTWAWLIYPQWDTIFLLGAFLNLLDLLRCLWMHFYRQPDEDPVLQWWNGLQDTDSEEEERLRMQIEEMRQEELKTSTQRTLSVRSA
eukprot:Skav232851  [mRNA]  locus=scaffold4108:15069:22813:+ [translate_table: standard]